MEPNYDSVFNAMLDFDPTSRDAHTEDLVFWISNGPGPASYPLSFLVSILARKDMTVQDCDPINKFLLFFGWSQTNAQAIERAKSLGYVIPRNSYRLRVVNTLATFTCNGKRSLLITPLIGLGSPPLPPVDSFSSAYEETVLIVTMQYFQSTKGYNHPQHCFPCHTNSFFSTSEQWKE